MAMTKTLITDEMRSIVGSVISEATSFPITASDIRKWAIAVYFPEMPPRIFWDEEYAATTSYGGLVAAEEFNPFAWMSREEMRAGRVVVRRSDFEARLGVETPEFRAILQSEVRVSYSGIRMRPGDVIRSTARIAEYFEREGKMGLQLYATIADTYINQADQHIKTLETVFVRYQ